ncbi:MAG TPA: oligosaccharide flippase family protein [Chitinophagales bacterium]|nr:oligosaccharide flippase family protein [Chitinophagales bacterium]HMW13826.1 oligosaccharide flippase family protein [Chitinophagales bacterium]HMX61077.1 oligosaccharide flippase family protein [Chitinophagales bacterium]HMY24212.1 oligosaccharide flippase family protein [Chitinophagales bacterium]HMZ34625.1 oligosaccharide flippase family protein [Chitinophagales bacterium]
MKASTTSKNLFLNFSTLFSGLLVVQIINFAFSLLLPKYCSPFDFAEFGIFTAIVFILIEIVNAKLDIAVMLGKDENKAIEILHAATTSAFVFTTVLLLIMLLFYLIIPSIYFLLPFVILMYGIHQPIIVLWNKKETYSHINTFRILQVLSTSISTILLAMNTISHALIIGFCIGIIVATSYCIYFYFPKIQWATTKNIWKKFDQFPKYGTWSALCNNFSRNSVPILLSAFFPANWVGFYAYATRLLNAPSGMYTSALGQLYFKKASELTLIELKKLTQKISYISIFVSIVPTLIILFFGKEIFHFLFGNEWTEAGRVAQCLILWYFVGMIITPISTILDIKNKLNEEFKYNFSLLIVRIMSILIGGIFGNFYFTIILFSCVSILLNLGLLYYIHTRLLQHD